MIEFKNISKSYGNQEVIKDFNLTIECGTFLTIIGSSGSGKTTILKMINGLIKADKGEVLINNKNIQDEDLIELRRKIGYVIQGNILFPHLTVFDNIAYVLNLKKYNPSIIAEINCPITVAQAAPSIPILNPNINSGSRIVFVIAPITIASIE